MEYLKREIAGIILFFLADKALYWPERKILFIADAHFGKAAAYRALGQPVPHGTTEANIKRLDSLLEKYSCEQLVFLGDFLHAPKSHAPATLATIAQWRQRHSNLVCTLIRGNHDLRAGDPPAYLDIAVVNEPFLLPPFAFRHIPVPVPDHHVVAGHLHPVYKLHGKGKQKLRLPCFHVRENITIMPSFGEFTGGHPVEVDYDSRIFVTEGSGIWEVEILNNKND